MIDYAVARANMVENQLRPSRIDDPRVLAAMGEVPRELFVPEAAARLRLRRRGPGAGGGRLPDRAAGAGQAAAGRRDPARRTWPW